MSGLLQYAVLSLSVAMMALCAATLRFPLQDASALAVDQIIGYDWRSYVRFIAFHPALRLILDFGYSSIFWQPMVICFTLSLRGRTPRLVTYQIATFATLIMTVAIFAVAPVTTAWVHDQVGDLPELRRLGLPVGSDGWVHLLMELRAGRARFVAWNIDAGIIGFPSFHCAAALLNCWALWRIPSLRFGALALNGVMIAATPLMGGHYLIDLIAGTVVALASLRAAKALYPVLAIARPWRLPWTRQDPHLAADDTGLARPDPGAVLIGR